MTSDQGPERVQRRRLRTLRCEIEISGERHAGLIRDLSSRGLFVTTPRLTQPGARVSVHVTRPGGEVWNIEAKVVRAADGSQSLVLGRGLGLAIEAAPAGFHQYVSSL